MSKNLAPTPYKVKTKNIAGAVVEENISVKDKMKAHENMNFRLCHKELFRKRASTVIGGFPIPQHNFATPLSPQDRDHNYHPFIDNVNTTVRKLNELG